MKNIIILLALISLFFSCSQTEDINLSEKIVGDWDVYAMVIHSCPEAIQNVPFTTAVNAGCIPMNGKDYCLTASFQPDGTGKMSYSGNVFNTPHEIDFEYAIDEVNNTVNSSSIWGSKTTFTFEDNKLALEMDEEGCICIFGFQS